MDWIRDHVGVGSSFPDSKSEVLRSSNIASAEFKESLDASRKSTILSLLTSYLPTSYFKPSVLKLLSYLDTPAYACLTTDYLTQHFNPSTPDSPNVKYYSYGASCDNMRLLSPLRLPWEIIKQREGDNDGLGKFLFAVCSSCPCDGGLIANARLVSVYSARWGEYIETVQADHWDLNNRRHRKGWSHRARIADYYKKLNLSLPSMPSITLSQPSVLNALGLNLSSANSSNEQGEGQTGGHQQRVRNSGKDDFQDYQRRVTMAMTNGRSFDEYVYGYADDLDRPSSGKRGSSSTDSVKDAAAQRDPESFDAPEFYLEIVDRLHKQGF
jgi:hypothetical protein